jgi:Cu-Zn family superoxide dismutase
MKKLLLLSCSLFLIIIACKTSVGNKNEIKITFSSKSESTVSGTANFVEKNGTVTMVANLSGLTPGEHAIHIHEKSDCSAADGSSAGGHWNPTFKKHGKWGSTEHHKGDIGNFTADANGNATVKFSTPEWCIGCEDDTKNILGKGLIVHKGIDDFTSQPAGNAGARVACSAIIK